MSLLVWLGHDFQWDGMGWDGCGVLFHVNHELMPSWRWGWGVGSRREDTRLRGKTFVLTPLREQVVVLLPNLISRVGKWRACIGRCMSALELCSACMQCLCKCHPHPRAESPEVSQPSGASSLNRSAHPMATPPTPNSTRFCFAWRSKWGS